MDKTQYNAMVEEIAQAVDAGSMTDAQADALLSEALGQLDPSLGDKLLSGVQSAMNYLPSKIPGFLEAESKVKEDLAKQSAAMVLPKDASPELKATELAQAKERMALAESAGVTALPLSQGGAAQGLLTKAIESRTTIPLGRRIFRSGLKKLDEAGAAVGKGPTAVSDTLLKYGISGTSDKIQKASNAKIGELEQEIQGLLARVPGKIDVDKAFGPARKALSEILDNPGQYTSEQISAAQKQLDEINRLSELNRFTPAQTIKPATGEQAALLPAGEATPLLSTKSRNILDIQAPLKGSSKAVSPEMALPQTSGGTVRGDWQKPLPSSTGETLPLFGERLPDVGAQPLLVADPSQEIAASLKGDPSAGLVQYTELTPTSRPMADQTSLFTGGEMASQKPILIPETAGMSVKQAKDLNKNLYQAIKKSSWNELMPSDVKSNLQKAMASGNKSEYMRVAEEFDPQLAARLDQALQEQGALLTARKAMSREAGKEAGKAGITQVDAMALLLEPKAFVAKQGAKAINSPWFRTGVGKYLNRPSSNVYETMIQRGIENQQQEQ